MWPDAEKQNRRPNGRNAYFTKTLIMTLTGRIFKKSFHQNSRLYAAIEGPHPLIEEILRFGFIDLGPVMAKSAVYLFLLFRGGELLTVKTCKL